MPAKIILTDGLKVPIHIWTEDIDDTSIEQLKNVAQLDFVFHHVAAMPDVHAGMGATIGSVIATEGAVIPAAVGVDIGCGMLAVPTNLKREAFDSRDLGRLLNEITRRVPLGRGQYRQKDVLTARCKSFAQPLEAIKRRHPNILSRMSSADWRAQLGTLGSGNHFIEIAADTEDKLWIMLHTGSRGVGNIMASYFIAKAKEACAARAETLPDSNLAYFTEGTAIFDDYMDAVNWAQAYAFENRQAILEQVLEALRTIAPAVDISSKIINCHHNYVAKEKHFGKDIWVTRKGAIRAGIGEKGIIPGSMGAQSYIVEGLGEAMAFESTSHGAGRTMSRTQAKSAFTVEDLVAQTEGVVCRKDAFVLDEIPAAYKDIDAVIENQQDLSKVIVRLKQLVCVKG